jgi:hypothetical protein
MSEQPDSPTVYAKEGGTRCPVCKSADIVGHQIDISAGHAYQEILCRDCKSVWTDEYLLERYSHLEIGKPEASVCLTVAPKILDEDIVSLLSTRYAREAGETTTHSVAMRKLEGGGIFISEPGTDGAYIYPEQITHLHFLLGCTEPMFKEKE